jgi:hypothetical protein
MAITFACVCGTELEALDGQVGRKVMCPVCRSDLTVPSRSLTFPTNAVPDLGIQIDSPVRSVVLSRRKPPGSRNSIRFPLLAVLFSVGLPVISVLVWGLFFAPGRPKDALPSAPDQVSEAKAEELRAIAAFDSFEAKAERAKLKAMIDQVAVDDEVERRKHRWLGGGGKVVRMTARDGLDRVEVARDRESVKILTEGMRVALADDFTPIGTSQDVMVASEFEYLQEVFSPGLEHRREDTRLAGEGLIFSVPRGTVAAVLEWRPSGGFPLDGQFVRVRFKPSLETAWVYGAHLR